MRKSAELQRRVAGRNMAAPGSVELPGALYHDPHLAY
jgi:hypothetical protein